MIRSSDLIRVDEAGEVDRGRPRGQRRRRRHPLRRARRPARRRRRGARPRPVRQDAVGAGHDRRAADPGRLRLLRGHRQVRRRTPAWCSTRRRAGGSARRSATRRPSSSRNHGMLTVGETVDSAAWWFLTLERTCQSQLMAYAARHAAADRARGGDADPRPGRLRAGRLVPVPADHGADPARQPGHRRLTAASGASGRAAARGGAAGGRRRRPRHRRALVCRSHRRRAVCARSGQTSRDGPAARARTPAPALVCPATVGGPYAHGPADKPRRTRGPALVCPQPRSAGRMRTSRADKPRRTRGPGLVRPRARACLPAATVGGPYAHGPGRQAATDPRSRADEPVPSGAEKPRQDAGGRILRSMSVRSQYRKLSSVS